VAAGEINELSGSSVKIAMEAGKKLEERLNHHKENGGLNSGN
jgi:hypothetical protein